MVRRTNAVHAMAALIRVRLAIAVRHELDLAGFLNRTRRKELAALCGALGLEADGGTGAMRQRLWAWGAAFERAAVGIAVAPRLQPAPVLVGGMLRARRRAGEGEGALISARAARAPASPSWPRPVLPARPAPPCPPGEPADLEELLGRADALVGVRLGARGRDKGEFGQKIAALLGLARSADPSPDFRGEVEVKSLAVARGARGRWRIQDGPAISMRDVDAAAKSRRVLWVIRVDETDSPGSPILSWFYQELDAALAAAFERARHLRPKGGAGTTRRGWYLRRGFFAACGLLASINGA